MDKRDMQALQKMMRDYTRAQYAAIPGGENAPAPTREDVMLPMRDGARLRTITYKPAALPCPAILTRTCYPDQDGMMQIHGEELAKRGFAFVYQYCRGTGGSEGEWEPNVNERNDGKDTLDWLAAQEWASAIGINGSSYLALTGWVVADLLPEKVKSLYLTHYGTDRFTSAYKSGLFRQDVLTSWAMGNAGFPVEADYLKSAAYRPQIEVDEALWGQRLPWYRDWITATQRGDAYWQQGFWALLAGIPQKVQVPVCIVEGWYDHHLGSALQSWQALGEEARRRSVLRIGAWNHGFMPCVRGQKAENLQNSTVAHAYEWFTQTLQRGEAPEGRVEVYTIGADSWSTLPAYPFPDNGALALYPRQDGSLGTQPDGAAQTLTYTYDPENPVPSHGAEAMLASTETAVGSLPQPAPGWREDVLSFVSEPFLAPLSLLGKIEVTLRVASTAEDTAFTAKLMEVQPDGTAYNIRGSIGTLAFRAGDGAPRGSYTPGEAVTLTIEMWDIAWQTQPGSRLRLDVSSSDFPQYAVHTNRPGVWALQTGSVPARQTLHLGPGGCHVRLPLATKEDAT